MEKKFLIILLSIVFLLRLKFLSPWLEDWDSVQFVLALDNFSIADHLPHPPGYIGYIFLGRLLNLIFKDGATTLTLLSTILGTAAAIPFYFLANKLLDKPIAFLATLLLLVTPVSWTLSAVALTNIPGMFFTITTALFLYLGKESRRYLFIGSFLAGLTLGVRFAEYSILIALMGLVILIRKSWQDAIKSLLYSSAGLLVWLIPLIIDTGWKQFLNLYTNQVSYIASHDSLLAYNSFWERLPRIWELFVMGYTVYFVPFLLIIIWKLVKDFKTIHKNFSYIFLLTWFFSYLIPLIFAYNLEVTRHLLPLLPPLILLSAISIKELSYQKLSLMLTPLLTVFIFKEGLDQAQKLHSLTPPSIAPVLYVKENHLPQNTKLITTFTYRQFEYYAPEYQNSYGLENFEDKGEYKFLITDLFTIKDRLINLRSYNIIDEKNFAGPEEIFPRLPKTNLFILEKNK